MTTRTSAIVGLQSSTDSKRGDRVTQRVGHYGAEATLYEDFASVLTEQVSVTENGRKKKITKQRALVIKVVHDGITGNYRAIKMLHDLSRDIENRKPLTEMLEPPELHIHFGKADEEGDGL